MLASLLSVRVPVLLAVLAAWNASAQLTFNPPNEVPINEQAPSTAVKFKLAAAPKGNVDVVFEAPNFKFDKCKVTFTPQNWQTEQTVQATPLPIFGDFQPKVDMKLKTISTDAADKTALDSKDVKYTLTRGTAKAGTCTVFNDPHFSTFDGNPFDIMLSDCMTMVWSDNLIVQINTVPYNAVITLTRDMAFRYNGAVIYFSADRNCETADQAVLDKAGIRREIAGTPNTNGYSGKFFLSDGTTITATNTMAAQDGKWAMNVQIDAPCYLRNKVKGICGNFNGKKEDDNLGPDDKVATVTTPSIWQGIMNALGTSWKCKDTNNLFKCKDKCPDFPKPGAVPDSNLCSIAKGLADATPKGYNVDPPMDKYAGGVATDEKKPVPGPPPPNPEIVKQAETACQAAFKQDDCKDKFVSQDQYLKNCLADSKAAQNTNFVEGIRLQYVQILDTFTAPIGQDPKHPRNKEAFDCRKKLGLGKNECLNACTSPANGACLASGCKCSEGFTGDDCSIKLPPPAAVAAAPKEPAAAAAGGACNDGDLDNYDAAMKPVSYDKCHTITGEPGIFDDDGDAKKVDKSDVRTCEDRGKGTYCIFVDGKKGSHLNCTADNSADDNKYGLTCVAGYMDDAPCYPKTANKPGEAGKCQAKTNGFADAAKFDKRPCDYFPNVKIPAGEKRFFCIGLKGQHLLQCPENVIKKCDTGCVSKLENQGKPDERQCGKAACAGGAKAATKDAGYKD